MSKSDTRDRVLDALEKQLARRAGGEKSFRIGLSSVCAEAGLSRNALYQGHPDLVALIRERIAANPKAKSKQRKSGQELAENIKALKREVVDALSEKATLLFRAERAEARVKELLEQARHDR